MLSLWSYWSWRFPIRRCRGVPHLIHLRTTGRDVLNIFRYAREKAVTEQVGMRVTVDREKQRMVVSDDLGDGGRSYLMPKDVKISRLVLGGKEVTGSIHGHSLSSQRKLG